MENGDVVETLIESNSDDYTEVDPKYPQSPFRSIYWQPEATRGRPFKHNEAALSLLLRIANTPVIQHYERVVTVLGGVDLGRELVPAAAVGLRRSVLKA